MKLFSANTYIKRRNQLKKTVKSGLILLLGNEEAPLNYTDNHYRFRQDSSFLYFFGLNQAGLNAIIDVDSGEEMIFGNEFSIDDIIWVGQQETIASKAQKVGIDTVLDTSQLASQINTALAAGREIHFLPPYRQINTQKLAEWLNLTVKEVEEGISLELIKAIINLRSYKSAEEVAEMSHAVNVSREMHINAMRSIAPGKKEYEVVAEIYRTAKANNCYLSYPAIFSVNGQTLHNHYHGNIMEEGQLVLNDSGAENEMCYAGDITRTIPVSGKFSQKQKEIYEMVLAMEETSIAALKPNTDYRDLHIAANKLMLGQLKQLGLVNGDPEEMSNLGVGGLFMPHGLGHMIGLDVHDMEDLGENHVGYGDDFKRSTQLGLKSLRLAKALETGFTLTVEPGIYFISELIQKWKSENKFTDFINYQKLEDYYDFGGIRIEDNILITEAGAEVLGEQIPKSVSDLEGQ